MQTNELNIIMVAPRQIGKTSLLAAMHEEFDKTFERANLQTWTDDTNTLQAITECKQVLRTIDPKFKKKVKEHNPSLLMILGMIKVLFLSLGVAAENLSNLDLLTHQVIILQQIQHKHRKIM